MLGKSSLGNSRTPCVFVHGGPGLNSFAEKAVLEEFFKSAEVPVFFWNEPSQYRPSQWRYSKESAYQNLVESLRQTLAPIIRDQVPVHLIAHSFGAYPVMELCQDPTIGKWIQGITFIGLSLDLNSAYKNILKLAEGDFQSISNADQLAKVSNCIAQTETFCDSWMMDGLKLALQDPQLLGHYWIQPGQMQKSLAALMSSPEAQPDFEAMFDVLEDMRLQGRYVVDHSPISIPTQILCGDQDVLVPISSEYYSAMRRKFPNSQIEVLKNAGHYAHIDHPDLFWNIVQRSLR